MSGEQIIIDGLAALTCLSGAGAFLILIEQARNEARERNVWGVFGDVPTVPEGLRGHGRKPGGGGGKAAPAQVRTDDIAHRGQGR